MHWHTTDGDQVASELNIKKVQLINDFTAVGLGALKLKETDYSILNPGKPVEGAPKVVIGPGTGLGVGYMTKDPKSSQYECFPSEGGHVEFPIRSEKDWKFYNFAKKFIETSNNVENLRAKTKLDRFSIERACAGPAIPLIYSFLAEENQE